MAQTTSRYPFEATGEELQHDIDSYVDAVVANLESEFLIMPKGQGFVEYADFEDAYEVLKRHTSGFSEVNPSTVTGAVDEMPLCAGVLRTMLALTAPEWAYLASVHTGVTIAQGYARTFDRSIRLKRGHQLSPSRKADSRFRAMIETACTMLASGAPEVAPDQLHRMARADTAEGLSSVRQVAEMGAPYAMLLYERFLGRPFATHRDSVSGLIGDTLESAIEKELACRGVSYRKTGRAEKIPGFDQAPDFCIPSEYSPRVVIEAKIAEDDGTARDKVTRVQHLAELAVQMEREGRPRLQVIACIGGRGFSVRREDMRKMLLATEGKVFTARTLDRMVTNTRLAEYATR